MGVQENRIGILNKNKLPIVCKVAGKSNRVSESGLVFYKVCSKIYIEICFSQCLRGMGCCLFIVYWFCQWTGRTDLN